MQITHKDDDTALVVHLELRRHSVVHQLEPPEHSVDSETRQRIPAHQEHLVNQLKLILQVDSALEHLDQQIPLLVDLEQAQLLVHLVRMHLKRLDLVQERRVDLVLGQQADLGLVRLVLSVKQLEQEHSGHQSLHLD